MCTVGVLVVRTGLETDSLRAGRQQTLASIRGNEELLFPVRQTEGGGEFVDGLRGLPQQDLGRGVADDGPAEVGAQDIAGVLGRLGETGPVFRPRREPRG